jgi:hypothetical protein
MPDISKIQNVLYDGNQPYHVHYDNLPLKNILTRIDLVNSQVDINTDILRGSCGSVGTLNNRLSVSIEEDGKIKNEAMDEALHNIGAHSDGSYDGVDYVRMKQEERDKLSFIESNANNLTLQIEDAISNLPTIDNVTFENGSLSLRSSDTISFQFLPPNILKAHSIYSPETAHVHNYQIVPAHVSNYTNYSTTILNTPYKEGSLRVYVNGFRIGNGSDQPVKVLLGSNPSVSVNWSNLYISSQSPSSGEFSINSSVEGATIFIDFDQNLS